MSSKSENRIERKHQKNERNREKNIKLANSIGSQGVNPRNLIVPELTKRLVSVSAENYKEFAFEYSVEHADKEGEWSWREPRDWTNNEDVEIQENKLRQYLKSTWRQVETDTYNASKKKRGLSNKTQKTTTIIKEAQERLKLLRLDDIAEELFRLRVGSCKRIWGIRIDSHFFVIWYERYHHICPPACKII